jgi:hypothetical protein
MRVNRSRTQADEICKREYRSRLLSYIAHNDSPHDLRWWTTQPKPATSGRIRRHAAVRAYLSLSQYAVLQLRCGAFPAVFDFNEGTRARVDKGIVKVLLDNDLISHRREGQELLFYLTSTGNVWLSQNSSLNPSHIRA